MKSLIWIERTIARLEAWLIELLLWLMVILTFLQISMRALYLYAHLQWASNTMSMIDWSEPMVRLFVLWISMLGASLLTRENKHIKIDLLSGFLSPRWLSLREILISLVSITILGFMLKASVGYLHLEMEFGGKIFLALPGWVALLILPIGFTVILFRFFIRAIEQCILLLGWRKR